jgi:Undecaprenyl-phosphate galactose phosphotransferase WbaP
LSLKPFPERPVTHPIGMTPLVDVAHPRSSPGTGLRRDVNPLPWDSRSPLFSRIGMLAADVVAIAIAASLIVALRAHLWGPMPPSVAMWGAVGVWFSLRAAGELYGAYGLAPPEELRRGTITTLLALLVHASLLFALNLDQASRFIALGMWVVLLAFAWVLRGAVKYWLVRKRLYGFPVIVLGAGETGREFIRMLRASPHHGLMPVAVFDDDISVQGRSVEGVPVLGPTQAALMKSFPYEVKHAVLAMPGAGRARVVDVAHRLSCRFQSVTVVPDLLGLSSLWVRSRTLGSMVTLEFRHDRFRRSSLRWKRAFDLAFGVPLSLVALPVIAICAAAVKLRSPGPAFFGQLREGQNGQQIRVWKIRTMVLEAERHLEEFLRDNNDARAQWEKSVKLERDPRIIPIVGALLRRYSLDELPQLWNVIRGDMSLVGPRPFPDYHLARFPSEFRDLRRQVPPGVSGYWQVTERSDSDLPRQEAADSYYIHNWSLWLDMWILLRTFGAVLAGKGAY